MLRPHSFLSALCAALLLASCTIPRGAALQSEVLEESNSEVPTFQVVSVTRANMPAIASWPKTGDRNTTGWPATSSGYDSNVIHTGDKLNITIWDSEENSLLTNTAEKSTNLNGVEVGPNGSIFVPYINMVRKPGGGRRAGRAGLRLPGAGAK